MTPVLLHMARHRGLDETPPGGTKLVELGGKYERGPKWAPFAVRDGALVTGQNPASSTAVAKLVIEALDGRST